MASIGLSGKGLSDSNDAGAAGEMVAICDADAHVLNSAGEKRFPKAKRYTDFRKMLEEVGDRIDAVTVSTPDHNRAAAALMAMRMGKHCFCQIWDWNVWLGPAPARPFGNGYHPSAWRGWWDFGAGALGDMACHSVNMPYLALKLRDPVAIQAETSGHDGDGYPQWSIINFDFPAISGRPAVKLFWYDGGKRPGKEVIGDMSGLFKAEIEAARKSGSDFFASGCAVVGDEHTLFSPGDYATTRCALRGAALPEIKSTQSPGHFAEWSRHPGRRAGHVEFPQLFRPADGDHFAGQPGGLGGGRRQRRAGGVGRRELEVPERGRPRNGHQAALPSRLHARRITALVAVFRVGWHVPERSEGRGCRENHRPFARQGRATPSLAIS